MNKKVLFTLSVVLCLGFLYFTSETASEKQLREYTKLIKEHPYNKRMHLSKKERKTLGIPPNAYFDQEYLNEINPNTGRTHPENVLALQKKLKLENLQKRVPGDAADNSWLERGPNNVGGRTRVVLFDPNDENQKRVFAGAVSGGLWVNNDITDAAVSWVQVGISENLSVSTITVDPNNPQIWYIGTGESYTGSDALGNGVWKSIDGGANWSNIYNEDDKDIKNRLFYINDIVAWNNPITNKSELFIGVGAQYYGEGQAWIGENATGLYKSIDGGANWTKPILSTTGRDRRPYEPNDFEIGADNSLWFGTGNNVWGDGGGTIFKSIDGLTFTKMHEITGGKRTEIAVSKSDVNTVYVLAEVSAANEGPVTILKTTDSFETVSIVNLPRDADSGIPSNDFTRAQAFYDLMIEVDPNDDATLFVGGIDLFKSTNSGLSWSQKSHWYGGFTFQEVHADQHGIAFSSGSSTKIIFGNDGGVFYTNDGGEVIGARNKGYNVTQFYNGAIGQSVSNERLLSGAQDNGTQMIDSASSGINASLEIRGGDGAYSFIDKDGEYVIASYVYNSIQRINLPLTGGFSGVTIENDSKSGKFINPAELDDNLDILYTNASKDGNDSIARYSDIKTQNPIRKNISSPFLNGSVTALKVSPFTTSSTKLFIGTSNGQVMRIENADTTPIWFNTFLPISSGSVSSINFGSTEDEILVTYHNFGVISIWYTANGGGDWVPKEGDFPDIPVKAIMMNPLNNDEVIIGTQLGVWKTSNFKDTAVSWVPSNNGMSNVKVTSFSLRTADNTILASTYGRGMFTGQFTAAVASVDAVLTDREPFTVYPTISKGSFTVFAKSSLGKVKMSVFDISGRQIYKVNLDFGFQEKQEVSLNVNSGIYFVNLVNENGKKSSKKIIVQ
jgi:hypothetical protein